MSDYVRSIVRTVVPALWAAVVAWAIAQGIPGASILPADVPPAVLDAVLAAAVPAVLAVVYGALRLAEAHLPAPLARLLLGSAVPPGYGSTDLDASDGNVTIGGRTYTSGLRGDSPGASR